MTTYKDEITTQPSTIKSSPQVVPKSKSKLSTKSIMKIPHSPSMKRKKAGEFGNES
jgi:hypothetical protein